MKLPDLAIRRPVAVLMAICIIIILGGVSLANLPLDLYPEFDFPIAVVITEYQGTAPQEMETMVTRPLEESLATVQGVKNISSTSGAGSSLILMQFDWGMDLDFALLDIREKIDMVKGFLPDDTGDPWVLRADPSMMPSVQLSFFGERESWELRRIAEEVIKPRLERIEGVASVSVVGGRIREIQVNVDPYLLNHYSVPLEQLSAVLASESYNVSAGTVQEGAKTYHIRTIGEFADLDDLRHLVIRSHPQETVLLKDVADVDDFFRDPDRINLFNGKPSVGLEITKQSDANTVQVSRAVWNAVAEIQKTLPEGVYLQKVLDQADFINDSVLDVFWTGVVGAILAVMILLLFLRNFRSTLVVAMAIPVSVISTFVIMYFYGLTLNIVSLGGLALGLGIMVDNSIVVLENIYRTRQEGLGPLEAAAEGSNEVTGAITSATLTTVVVFLPVVFVGGLAAQIFQAMALTVSFSLMVSLLVALTIVPLLSSRLLVKVSNPEAELQKAERLSSSKENIIFRLTGLFLAGYARLELFYRKILVWALGRRKFVLLVFTAVFLATFVLVPFIGVEFLPQMDQGYISVSIQLPRGSALEETEAIALQAQEIVSRLPEVEGVNVSVGSGGVFSMEVRGQGSHQASLDVILKDLNLRKRSAAELAEEVRAGLAQIAGAEFSVSSSAMDFGALSGPPISVAVRGDDLEELELICARVAEIIAAVPGTRDVETSFKEGQPEVQVIVDRKRAAAHGLAYRQVANVLRLAVSGQVSARYRTEGRELDVRVGFPEGSSDSLVSLEMLALTSPYGYQVPLLEVSNFIEGRSPINISRYNQVRTASVTAGLAERNIRMVIQDITAELDRLVLPEGYFIDYEGEQQMMSESFEDLTFALILAVILVYMIMAAQFESLLHPLIIMFALPQTFTGVSLGLFITGRTLSVPAFIGVIMLAGIVVNNGIVLVDYVNKLRERGYGVQEALLAAGPVRLRPILMTTLTTILAMLPLALGFGSGAELRAPLATVVIGGLLVSTMLTLVVVPVAYSALEDIYVWFNNKFSPGTDLQSGSGPSVE